jgi:hypothetical protein
MPLGFAMWAAHLLYHLSAPWSAHWLPSAQILLLDAGLLLTLYVAWQIAKQCVDRTQSALALITPWAVVSCALYAAGVWILFQPMQMRGMLS